MVTAAAPVAGDSPAVLLEKPTFSYFRNLPGCELLKKHKLHDYVVADIEADWLSGTISEPIIPVDTRPWMKKTWKGKPIALQTRSPDVILALMSGAKAVITESLHMSIMAMAMGTPFAVSHRGATSAKPLAYFNRAGFPEAFRPASGSIVKEALAMADTMLGVRKEEQDAARKHLDNMVSLME